MNKIIVTKLRRESHGELESNLTVDGITVEVTRRFGSWGTPPDSDGRWLAIQPHLAAELQERARRFERAEAKNATP